ncbi:glutathione peroxidase [Roseococcus sp. DSY-14]|uniref:glutathione peroxidase n=1 Tax=Roseococcus sp. DSY-14 TaxID=3369650 RepID=UPI00387AADB6
MVDIFRRAALLASSFIAPAVTEGHAQGGEDAWTFSFQSLEGEPMPLAQWRGRALLVVNTASFCGFTKQYEGLQRLHERYEPRGLTVIGVPSADFNQESAEASKVRDFCDTMFGITFPMAAINHVRGEAAHPFYRWLTAQSAPVRWNFQKYLVSRDGRRVTSFSTATGPESPRLTQAIEAALAAS